MMKIDEMYRSKHIIDTIRNKKLRKWLFDMWDERHPYYMDNIHKPLIDGDLSLRDLLRLQFQYRTGVKK